jgi:peptidoglycan/LPS O-acetylase OafA/YrhL
MGVNAPHWGELGTEVAASHLLISAGYRQLHNHPQPRFPAWLPLMTLVIAVACYSTAAPWWCSRLISPFMLAFTINHLATISGWFRSLLSTQPFILLGIWSFSIYLWQQPFFTYKEIFPGKGITAFFLVFIVSFSSYRFIEQPCRNWLNRNW